MTDAEIRQAIVDGCSAGQGLDYIVLCNPGMPSTDEIKRTRPEIAQFYLEQKQQWTAARARGIDEINAAIAAHAAPAVSTPTDERLRRATTSDA